MTPKEYAEALDGVEQLLLEFDDYGFKQKMSEASGVLLPCTNGPLERPVIGKHHLLLSIHLQMLGDEDKAMEPLASARVMLPELQISDDLLGADHPLRVAWTTLPTERATRRVPEPKVGSLSFDGAVGRERPKEGPVVFQRLDDTGTVLSTSYLSERESLPPYEAIPRLRNTLLATAGGALAGALVFQGLAFSSRGSLVNAAGDPALKKDELDAWRGRVNTFAVTSGVFLLGAGGAAGAAAAVGQR